MRGSDARSDGGGPTVLALPDYRGSNPYQTELEAALREQGVDIRTDSCRGLALPITRALLAAGRPPVLHLHFVTPYMYARNDRLRALGLARFVSVLLGVRLLVDLALAARLTDRVVWTAHNLKDHQSQAVRTELALKHAFVRFVCDVVIVHCDRASEVLIDTFRLPAAASRKMRTIPHGHFLDAYPDETTRKAARAELGLPQDATVLLFFGWIRRYKNVPSFIDVFTDLDRDDLRLVVAGNPETDALAREVRAAARGDGRVTTELRFVPDEEVQTFMRAADLATLPFCTEDQSLLTSGSAILSMGFGCAVVAPRLGCIENLLTEGAPDGDDSGVSTVAGGVVYDSNDQLETAIDAALATDLERAGSRNRRYVEALDWDHIAAHTARVYRATGEAE